MAGVPLGWGDRHTTNFGGTAKNAYENDTGDIGYKTNEQVREFYLTGAGGGGGASSSVEAKGVVQQSDARDGNGDDGAFSAEVALVQIATHTLEKMAKSLEGSKNNIKIPMAERAAFANAMKEAMNALAKQA
mmetsp:Transcript_29479/g.62572  ORF Transcript_29479/g.62572 Transcript_29479/m.62572 type:complete len:132 (+) Transcript_29479:84-479(+)|eukprot:CAMPEP_0172311078 /NCGR_PEP_ID=MMETSP1058-20130122/13672_1 /TAXON_ID=83371 /ORGANISM="Detonula confervacea, Strain CCMP 353" /LENGTH=131 /DNA_ID=CAMNT_0013024137 /DNA_START=17 /DNA_END=412 /DNA_ORIENTATION=-